MKKTILTLLLAVITVAGFGQSSGKVVRRSSTAPQKQQSGSAAKPSATPKATTPKTPSRSKTTTRRKQSASSDATGYTEYEKGNSFLQKDQPKTAAYWYKIASDKGYAPASYILGLMYKEGYGVEEDRDKAHELYEVATPVLYEAGVDLEGETSQTMLQWVCNMDHSPYNAWAHCIMGYRYLYGKNGYREDNDKAFENLKAGAEEGSKTAMYYLGLCYKKGWGTYQNASLGDSWISRSGHSSITSLTFTEDYDDINSDYRSGYYFETGVNNDGLEWCFIGNYRNGYRNDDRGFMSWGDDEWYMGEFKGGERTGTGVYHWPSGAWYNGEFKNGQRHGEGTYHYTDGTWEKGLYNNNTREKILQSGK